MLNSPFARSQLTRPAGVLHDQQLKTVLERAHIRVLVPPELKGVGDDLDGPVAQGSVAAGLEAEVEIAWVFWVDAEDVHDALGVGVHVGGEPLVCGGG
jgi:hypothetical protein